MGVTPDGYNINKDCGSTSPEALSRKVHEVRADIGIALDGDADRVIIVDENGTVVDGDQLMAVVAQSWQASDRLAGEGIVATVMSNLGLERYLDSLGLNLARTKVGDRYVVEEYLAEGGMGAIYVGKKLGAGGFEKKVVLKQLLPEFTQQPEFIDLFLREARLSATLDHANIILSLSPSIGH